MAFLPGLLSHRIQLFALYLPDPSPAGLSGQDDSHFPHVRTLRISRQKVLPLSVRFRGRFVRRAEAAVLVSGQNDESLVYPYAERRLMPIKMIALCFVS